MKLSEYCILVKPYIESSIKTIKDIGYARGYNNKEYDNVVEFLDDSVLSIVEYSMGEDIEKDVDYAEAMRLSGIVEGYLQNTGIAGKVIKERNPLGFLKK